ncbi:MAG: flagellar hook-length control protein FliK [Desulfobaccales bacterium]
MQAAGVTPPNLNVMSLSTPRAQGYPSQDKFQSLLQQRIASRSLDSSASRFTPRSGLSSQLGQARPVSSAATSDVLNNRSKWSALSSSTSATSQTRAARLLLDAQSGAGKLSGKSPDTNPALAAAVVQPNTQMPEPLKILMEFLDQQPGQSLKVPPDQVQELKGYLLQAGLPAAQVDSLINSDSFQTKGLTAQDLQAAWQGACQDSSQKALVAQLAQATPTQVAKATVNLDMPPVLKALTDLLNQQPGQALKMTPERLQQAQAFLLKAGIPPEQVENLLNSSQVQEQGLTASDVQATWQKSLKSTVKQALTASGSQLTAAQDLASQPDYQSLWQNLTVPPQALADLRMALQKLGATPDALKDLNTQNFPNGVPVTQVWQLIQQTAKSANNAAPLLGGKVELEKWRQLLTQSGMDPEVAQKLTSGLNPTNQGELRADLEQMAPQPTPPGEEVAKPLYLPQGVRVRQVSLLQNEAGQGHGAGNSNLGQNLGSPSQAQAANLASTTNPNTETADVQSFLAYLNSNAAPQTGQTGAPEVATGGQLPAAVPPYLTPEVKEALWSQVQSGVLGNLRPGENQVTLTLNPPDLGKLDLTLNLKGQTVEVIAVTPHAAVAEAGTAGMQQLAQALGNQGLILTQFQFHHQDEAQGQPTRFDFAENPGDQRQSGKKESDSWEQPATPRRPRWTGSGGIDCFA